MSQERLDGLHSVLQKQKLSENYVKDISWNRGSPLVTSVEECQNFK